MTSLTTALAWPQMTNFMPISPCFVYSFCRYTRIRSTHYTMISNIKKYGTLDFGVGITNLNLIIFKCEVCFIITTTFTF